MIRYSKIAVLAACITVVILASAVYAAAEAMYAQDKILQEISQIPLPAPAKRPPPLTQDSVDLALLLYNIKVPNGVKSPIFVANLPDRGITMQKGVGHQYEIQIGPAAFVSWGMLGSTLAHEVEVHCNQNFVFIRMLDLLGLDGTSLAEREAYRFEFQNAQRFHLSAMERNSILDTMEFYYPPKAMKRASMSEMLNEFCQFLVSSEPPKITYSALSNYYSLPGK